MQTLRVENVGLGKFVFMLSQGILMLSLKWIKHVMINNKKSKLLNKVINCDHKQLHRLK